MAACTFFGHKDAPDTIRSRIKIVIEDLIRHHDVRQFYVGNQGRFDAMVISIREELAAGQVCKGIILTFGNPCAAR